MDQVMQKFLRQIMHEAKRRPKGVSLLAADNTARQFLCYDWGSDSFILEKGVSRFTRDMRMPITVTKKSTFMRGAQGYIFTLTGGNHGSALMPLLDGKFWNFGHVSKQQRSQVMAHEVVCANIVNDRIDIFQRDTYLENIVAVDEWFRSLGLPLNRVMFAEHEQATIDYYRRLGQEWRVTPLAWTQREMEMVLASSRRKMRTQVYYYYNVRGVHFVTYSELLRVIDLALKDFPEALAVLRTWVSLSDHGGQVSYMRLPKYRDHHEVECFGLPPGFGLTRIVPALEQLMEDVTLKRKDCDGTIDALSGIASIYRMGLENQDYANEKSPAFIETMYRHVTGNVYSTAGSSVSMAFDDRKLALPGATFYGGRPQFHPGADSRTRNIVGRMMQMVNFEEQIEYVNVYEIRTKDSNFSPGTGTTREIAIKTNRTAHEISFIEKELANAEAGYASYMLTRANVFCELGAFYCSYSLVTPPHSEGRQVKNYFIRSRCQGYPLNAIPRSYYMLQSADGAERESPDVILAIAGMLGEAAGQNMIAQKFIKSTRSCRFGEGKEIFEFGYDPHAKRVFPKQVRVCSIRGIMGWPHLTHTQKTLDKMYDYYQGEYAQVCYQYWKKHAEFVDLEDLATRFFEGFAGQTYEMYWKYQTFRSSFDNFTPQLRKKYDFQKRWAFVLWALGEQQKNIHSIREIFMSKIHKLQAAYEAAARAAQREQSKEASHEAEPG